MKKLNIVAFLLIAFSFNTNAQTDKYLSKVKTLDSTIKTLYAVISGEKGEARDWKLFNYLFRPEAKLIPSGPNQQGETTINYITPQDYINNSGSYLINTGFQEKETARTVHKFGNIAQVFTTYEAYNHENKTKPFMTGINSIQLIHIGNRWWIVNVFWQQASKKHPIPAAFKAKN